MITEPVKQVNLAKASSQPQSTYEATATLTAFELKKILIDKMNSSESYLTTSEHRECYDGLPKAPSLNQNPLERLFTQRNQSLRLEILICLKVKKGIRLITLAASTFTGISLKEFDELVSTPIEFSSYILNGLKIKNLTQEILLGPAFRLLKATLSNYAELEYDFEECYKALSEKLDWDNPKGSDYPFDLSKPLPFITHRNHQSVPVEFFINNDLKYLQGGISTMTYTTSTAKIKANQYDLPGIEDMVPNIWITHVSVMRKHGYGYLEEIVVRRANKELYKFKEEMMLLTSNCFKNVHQKSGYSKRNRLIRSDELYKFSDGTLTRLISSLEDITKNIDMEYFPKRRWSKLEKKRAYFMINDINKLLKERKMMRSLEKFVGSRL
nr:hypothetical protein [Tanacetum cinerariifolium]